MMLSETNWRYKKPVEALITKSPKYGDANADVNHKSRIIQKSSKFFTTTLCEYKAIAIVALLLVFQFSLYDFNIDEYVSSNPHGVTQDAQITVSV